MGKAAKSKREEKVEETKAAQEGDYAFQLPAFDEQKFIRREIQSAKASFYTLAIALGAGLVAVLLYAAPIPWYWGWLPVFASMLLLRPFLQRMRFPEEVTSWKALIGSYLMMFFTALSVWILGVNLL